jgi:glycine cleavage system H protein
MGGIMEVKDNLKYTKDHEWVLLEDGVGTIGITDFAQGELGDVVYVELPAVGDTVTVGEAFGTIEAVKAVAELLAPVSGTISAINEKLTDDSATINADCYGEGWMVKITLSDSAATDRLLSASEYTEMISG